MTRTGLLLAIFAILLCGCDDRSKTSSDAAPTTSPAATAPTTRPLSVLKIDGESAVFPPAKIIITKSAGGLDAVLCSDDAPGDNSFAFEMKLDVESTEDLPSIAWDFKAPDDRPQDSTAGIFMAGGRRQMQPVDVKVSFEKQGERILARLAGKFVAFDPQDANAPEKIVDVQGTLDALVQEQN
jgi:hypothetical protein